MCICMSHIDTNYKKNNLVYDSPHILLCVEHVNIYTEESFKNWHTQCVENK